MPENGRRDLIRRLKVNGSSARMTSCVRFCVISRVCMPPPVLKEHVVLRYQTERGDTWPQVTKYLVNMLLIHQFIIYLFIYLFCVIMCLEGKHYGCKMNPSVHQCLEARILRNLYLRTVARTSQWTVCKIQSVNNIWIPVAARS